MSSTETYDGDDVYDPLAYEEPERLPDAGTPTQVAHPIRSILRTLVASGVGAALAWLTAVLGTDLTVYEASVTEALTVAVFTVATALAQWLLTRPRLQRVLGLLGLGTGAERE